MKKKWRHSQIKKIKEFVTSRPTLKEWLKEVLQMKGNEKGVIISGWKEEKQKE